MFRTEITSRPSAVVIDHEKAIMTTGSCFAEVMGQRFITNKFNICSNPFGTIYNPISIFKLLEKAARREPLSPDGLVQSQSVYHHYDLHSSFGHTSENELWQSVNVRMQEVSNFLHKAEWVIITLGTALVYCRKDKPSSEEQIVANCHKIPAEQFEKRMLTVAEIKNAFRRTYDAVKKTQPSAKFIITVSPVRHVKETLELNSHSKAILRVAAGEIASAYADLFYFPAYEIMMDDLRDYRFYEKDMIHPNETAHDYIWEHFSRSYFSDKTIKLNHQIGKLLQKLNHRPFRPHSENHQRFLKKTLEEMEQLNVQLDFNQEIGQIKQQIL